MKRVKGDTITAVDDASLAELLDEARTARALASRRGRRVAGKAAQEAGSLATVLLDLAERGAVASVSTTAGTRTRGRVMAVGSDVVIVGDRWLRLPAIASVRPEDGAAAAADHDDRRQRGSA